MIGSTISRYKILAKLGEGGMGVVYKAQDTKLDRPVALKFLPAHLLGNEEVRKRFHREAKSAAALSHPNVCTVFEIDEADDQTFIAMELIEGESLDEKIARGPLPLDEALAIAQQIAEGLQAAHDRGVIHRDVKPENILVDAKGHVTIMDFGLAQLQQASRLTKADQTLGTTTYMSPEQAQGAEVDHRTDVWALGVVLYEMLVGERPFKGEYDSAILYSILNEQPEPITSLRTGVPMELEVAVNKALAKQSDERYQSLSDFLIDLRAVSKTKVSGSSRVMSVATPPPASAAPAHTTNPWMAAFALAAAAFLGLAYVHFSAEPPERRVRRFSFTPEGLDGRATVHAAVSPDGRWIVYRRSDSDSLWLRPMDSEQARMLPGTEGAYSEVFWSPDSRYVAFYTRGRLNKIRIDGGPPTVVAKIGGYIFAGGSWSPDGGKILFSTGANLAPLLYEVPASGGEPVVALDRVNDPKGPGNIRPHFLPRGSGPPAVLFCAGSQEDQNLYVWNQESNDTRMLLEGCGAKYTKEGFLVYQPLTEQPGLRAVPFSLESLETTGEPFSIADGGADPTVSTDGVLVFVDLLDDQTKYRLLWLDRTGTRLDAVGRPRESIGAFALSPSGDWIAAQMWHEGAISLWLLEVDRQVSQRLTFDNWRPEDPAWSPDGRRIVYSANRGTNRELFVRDVAGDSEPKVVVSLPGAAGHPDWSPDGRYIVFRRTPPGGVPDLWIRDLEANSSEGSVQPFVEQSGSQVRPAISPDGRYVAYCSNESGSYEVYVRRFPSGEGGRQVSLEGGCFPEWSLDGKELLYKSRDTLMTVEMETGDEIRIGSPRTLFSSPFVLGRGAGLDVAPNGRILVRERFQEGDQPTLPPAIHVTENWYEEFRDR